MIPKGAIAQSSQYDFYRVSLNTPADTIYMKRSTDSIYRFNWNTMLYDFIGRTNPDQYYQWPAFVAVPKIISDTTSLQNNINLISLKKAISDSGRAISNYITGFTLNKVRDSVAGLIPTNNNQLSNGSGFITGITGGQVNSALGYTPLQASDITGKKNVTDSGRQITFYATGYDLNKVRDSVTSIIPTNNNQLTNGAAYITTASISGKKDITDSGRNISNYTTGYDLNKVRDSVVNLIPVLTPYKLITDSGRNVSNYTTGYDLNKVRDSLVALMLTRTVDTLSASRAFNTAYQMSTTKYVDIRPSARIVCTLSLTGGQEGYITLQTSPDAITWTSVGQIYNSNTGSLTIGLNTSQSNGSQVGTILPPNYYWKLITTNVTGTPTYTMMLGNKTTY